MRDDKSFHHAKRRPYNVESLYMGKDDPDSWEHMSEYARTKSYPDDIYHPSSFSSIHQLIDLVGSLSDILYSLCPYFAEIFRKPRV